MTLFTNPRRNRGRCVRMGALVTVLLTIALLLQSVATAPMRLTAEEPQADSSAGPELLAQADSRPQPINTTVNTGAQIDIAIYADDNEVSTADVRLRTPPKSSSIMNLVGAVRHDNSTGAICILVYGDLDGDGEYDKNKPLIAGATVTVWTMSVGTIGQIVTDGITDFYCFSDLPAFQSYTVIVEPPPGYEAGREAFAVSLGPLTMYFMFGLRPVTVTPTPTLTPTPTPTTEPMPLACYVPLVLRDHGAPNVLGSRSSTARPK